MTFGIAGNTEKPEVGNVVELLLRQFARNRAAFVIENRLAEWLRRTRGRKFLKNVETVPEKKLGGRCDILISLGGDGTMLRMSRLVSASGTPILGVNLGKLGFLAETSVDELGDCVKELLSGRYAVEERMMLEAWVEGSKRKSLALNDIVVDLSVSSRMFSVDTFVNGELLSTFTGDGVIVSTPTGSTGYALSNGGPILTPTAEALMVSPICPHTLTARPVVIPDDSVVTMSVKAAPARIQVAADGQPQHLLRAPMHVTVQKARVSAKVVKRLNVSYYDVLRRKLHWGRDVRSPQS